jgi:MSHA biogenesis protein MshL
VGSSTSQQNVTPSGQVSTTTNGNFWKELAQNLSVIVGSKDGRSVIINQQAGVVVVRAYPDELRSVGSYLQDVQNNMNRQVVIEAQILEVALNAQFQSGINWKVLGWNQGRHDFGNLWPVNSITGVASQKPEAMEGIPDDFAGIFTLDVVGGGDFKTFIELLNMQGRVNVLSSPRIATTNNQKAVIKVGTDRFFVTNVSSDTTTGNTSTSTQNIELTPFFSGIALDVTPQIDDQGDVTLHIHPVISKVTRDVQSFQVNDKQQVLPLAQSAIRESDSIVHARNGQIIVIGGLMQNESSSYEASTPGTENVKPLSWLFKSKNKSSSKFELVILLKPVVINPTYDWNKQLQDVAQKFKATQGEFHYKVVKSKIGK